MKEQEPYKPNVELLQKQDEGEWRSFVENYGVRLLATAYKSGLTDFNAEDAVQDSLLNLYTHRENLDPNVNPIGYLIRSINNKAKDAGRYSQRHPQDYIEDQDFADNRFETSSDVDMRVDLEYALSTIEPKHQTILTMLPEYSWNEIAQTVDIPRGSLGLQIKNAQKAAQTAYERTT